MTEDNRLFLLSEALFEEYGFNCLPLRRKVAFVKDWQKGEPVDGWPWEQATDLGIICGRLSGVVCVDVDGYKNPDALAWVQEHWGGDTLIDANTNKKASYHLFYKYDPRWRERWLELPEGVEVKSDRQYVRWFGNIINEVEPEALPDPAPWRKSGTSMKLEATVAIPDGYRDNKVFEICCAMVGRGEPRHAVMAEAIKVGKACKPPLSEAQALKCARSAERYRKTEHDPESYDGAALATTDFGPIDWVVEEFVTAGLAVLAGKPKLGKSFLALQLGVAVARGDAWLDMPTDKGHVVYFALEDSPRRIGQRLKNEPPLDPGAFSVHFSFDGDLMDALDGYEDSRLIVIDTGGRGLKQSGRDADFIKQLGPVQQWAIRNNVCVLLVWHTRKSAFDAKGQAIDDGWESLLWGTEFFGLVDSAMLLKQGELRVIGREVAEHTLLMGRDAAKWYRKGAMAGVDLDILNAMPQDGTPISPKELEAITEHPERTLRRHIAELCKNGRIVKEAKGKYRIPM